jgi:predicted deacetylase
MLLVSIHDVSPAQAVGVAHLWELCRARGITPALLVVPNWHGNWPLERHPDFVDWVRERVLDGAEVALHGERHDEVGLPRGTRDRWVAWGKTAGEGEFLTLDASAANERLARGLALFHRLGLRPTGFVPPAWLARESTFRAAAAAGLAFSEDDHSIRLLQSGRQVASPVVRWSGRTALRAYASAGVARVRTAVQRRARYARIALHPGDLDHPATVRSLVQTLNRWVQENSPASYGDLLASVAA